MSEDGKSCLRLTMEARRLFVLEKADIAGKSYLLVTDQVEEEEADALILREIQEEDVVLYEVVEDEKELTIISKYFEELLDEVELKLE
ncbi:MAG: DUF1292 domain-containing protein [Eubacterium sp.]